MEGTVQGQPLGSKYYTAIEQDPSSAQLLVHSTLGSFSTAEKPDLHPSDGTPHTCASFNCAVITRLFNRCTSGRNRHVVEETLENGGGYDPWGGSACISGRRVGQWLTGRAAGRHQLSYPAS